MQRDDQKFESFNVRAADVRHDGSVSLNSARCPLADFPAGCTFAVRLAREGPLDGWSPFSQPVTGQKSTLLPEGGGERSRLES